MLRTYEIYDAYEKRFAKAIWDKPFHLPIKETDRKGILERTKRILAYDENLLPTIGNFEETASERFESYSVQQLRYTTWNNTYAAASLYLPYQSRGISEKLPLAFLVCGHGADGRLSTGYRLMAHRLAAMGLAVMVPDNIGQGDRVLMGHRDSVGPFYAGLTLQGLIVMETVALIRHMSADPRFDADRLGALGNSGGGTLTMMLAALCPELAVLSSSGYPSEFHYILSKERPHCSCNLLPGCATGPEMWEIYSLFAPKPLLLEQGANDGLIPVEYFERTVRKLQGVYALKGTADKLEKAVTKTIHPWDEEDRRVICEFLGRNLGVDTVLSRDPDPVLRELKESWHVSMPPDARTTDELAEMLGGCKMPEGTTLQDIFPPTFEGRKIQEEEIVEDLGRGPVMKILAQMECALDKYKMNSNLGR